MQDEFLGKLKTTDIGNIGHKLEKNNEVIICWQTLSLFFDVFYISCRYNNHPATNMFEHFENLNLIIFHYHGTK